MASWNNAPPLLQIAATQQGGRGLQFWGVTNDYVLITCSEDKPGARWSGWSPWQAGPPQVTQIAACQQNDGRWELWATDAKQQLWTIWQVSVGGGWSNWSGPNWNGAPLLNDIAAVQQGGSRGAQLWGITDRNMLVSTFQETPGGGWSSWSNTSFLNGPPAIAVAGAQQNNGNVGLWMLDQKQQLWFTSQISPGGNWQNWSGPNWNKAPKLQMIAAAQQGGSRGAQLWGIDPDGLIQTTYQETPGGAWSGWSPFGWPDNAVRPAIQLAAAQQNDGSVALWGLDTNLLLHPRTQLGPGGDWGPWIAVA